MSQAVSRMKRTLTRVERHQQSMQDGSGRQPHILRSASPYYFSNQENVPVTVAPTLAAVSVGRRNTSWGDSWKA
jgi:hypothetical protein